MRKRVLGKIIPANDSLVSPLTIVDMSFDPKSFAIVENRLTKDGDAGLERDHKGDYIRSGHFQRGEEGTYYWRELPDGDR